MASAPVWANGVWDTSTTTGTGTYTVSGTAVVGRQTFGTGVGNGNSCYYRAEDDTNGGWENGIGTYTASGTTLSRDTILSSSNSNAAVSWPSGTRQIFLAAPAEVAPATTFNVKGFGAKGDAITYVATTSITSGAATLTVTAGTFAAGDVGKTIVVPGAGAAGADLKTTISAVASTTSITLAANASTTLTSASKTLTYGTDDSAARDAAIVALVAAGRGVLYFPAGSYLCTTAAPVLSVPCLVLGDGQAGYDPTVPSVPQFCSRILFTSSTAILLTVTALQAKFSQLFFKCVATTPTAGAAVRTNGAATNQKVDFEDCGFRGFYVCVQVDVGGAWRMSGCFVQDFVDAGLTVQNTVNADAGDGAISDTWFYSSEYRASNAYVRTNSSLKMVNCKTVAGGAGSFPPTYMVDVAVLAGTSSDILIANCSFEWCTSHGIYVHNTAGNTFNNIVITGTQILLKNSSGSPIAVVANTLNDLSLILITGCVLQTGLASSQPAILLTKAKNVIVTATVSTDLTTLISQSGCSGVTLAQGGETAWTAPSLTNSWVNFGGSDAVAGYRKLSDGTVQLKGSIKTGTITTSAFTLPAGYRPAELKRFAVASTGAFGLMLVNTDGTVVPQVGNNSQFEIDVSFFAEA